MFDTDLMNILDAYEEMNALTDALNKTKSYGIDINLSVAKVDYDDYQCGLNVRIENHKGQEYEATSKVSGERMDDVLLTALQEISDEFQKQADAEELKAKKATTNVVESLKADNMLLERRVEELYKLLEEERNKNNQIKEEYTKQQTNDFYTLLDKIANKYYNR